VPAVNIGTRQFNRALQQDIINTSYESESILKGIGIAMKTKPAKVDMYGKGNSDELFKDILMSPGFWEVSKQKHFRDI
jgi:hypothetical protein